MWEVEDAARRLDEPSAARALHALVRLRSGRGRGLDVAGVRRFLTRELPRQLGPDPAEAHEVAWALGEAFERAGRRDLAEVARSPRTHAGVSRGRWVASFTGVSPAFWEPVLDLADQGPPGVPARAGLSLSVASALLRTVGEGLDLTGSGLLPPSTVRDLDDRFRWTEDFPWMRVREETDIAPLALLRRHLMAQGLLQRRGNRLVLTALGDAASADTGLLWATVVAPGPRWSGRFDRDALAVMAASVLRSADYSQARVGAEMAHVLGSKWRRESSGPPGGLPGGPSGGPDAGLHLGASALAQTWYRLGVPLGWWDTGHGPADRRPNRLGRAAAVTVFCAVANRPEG